MKARDEGYTLVEMLVVIGIIAALAAVLTPALAGQLSRAKAKAARLQLETIASSLETYKSDVGALPSSSEGLTVLVDAPANADGWLGPYLRDKKAIADPWGRLYKYELTADGQYADVSSMGSDGKEGGKGPAADISVKVQ